MADERVERRLTAIFAGDVAGYSRLMGEDDEGTLAGLNAHRREFLDPTIAEHRGRIVKRTGDGVLIEFASAVDAARCAVEIQRGMSERNAPVPPEKRIELRIGIHVGDIIIEDSDIFGDGVNVAARLESIAQPGGICISDDAYRQVRGKARRELSGLGRAGTEKHREARAGIPVAPRCAGFKRQGIRNRAHAARQAVDRRPRVSEHEWRR
jgi:adenylate cyclase